jgi:hypothetical protein
VPGCSGRRRLRGALLVLDELDLGIHAAVYGGPSSDVDMSQITTASQ